MAELPDTDDRPRNARFLHGDELGELARLLQAHTAMCQLSDMQVRGALELMQQRGYRIIRDPLDAAAAETSSA